MVQHGALRRFCCGWEDGRQQRLQPQGEALDLLRLLDVIRVVLVAQCALCSAKLERDPCYEVLVTRPKWSAQHRQLTELVPEEVHRHMRPTSTSNPPT